MIVLDSTSKVLRARLSAAAATTNPSFVMAYADKGGDLASNAGALNGTTNVTLVHAPASGAQRVIRSGTICNIDTAAATVILESYDGTTASRIGKFTLEVDSVLAITGDGLQIISATGALGGAQLAGQQLAGINDQNGTSYTLVLGDAGKDVRCNNTSAITLTVPPNSSVAFPIGALIAFSQKGAGAVTATAGSGVTVNAAHGSATSAQYDCRVLEKTDTDTWRVW